jgi:hypothetical protein
MSAHEFYRLYLPPGEVTDLFVHGYSDNEAVAYSALVNSVSESTGVSAGRASHCHADRELSPCRWHNGQEAPYRKSRREYHVLPLN